MVNRLIIVLLSCLITFSAIAGSSGYSGGGRSGFSSSRASYSSYSPSSGRSGWSAPSRSYSAPRVSYSRPYSAPSYSSHTTEVHHYNHGGGGGFWSGFMGGYLGGMMSQPHGYVQPVVAQPIGGLGVAGDNGYIASPSMATAYSFSYILGSLLTFILFVVTVIFLIKFAIWIFRD